MTRSDSSSREMQQTKASEILDRDPPDIGLLSVIWGAIVSFGGIGLLGSPLIYLLHGWWLVVELWLAVAWVIVGFTVFAVTVELVGKVLEYAR